MLLDAFALSISGRRKPTAHAELTAAGTRKGTYAYMAPEQLAGEGVTAAVDQWGLAVTLAELISGERVFAGDMPLETMQSIERGAKRLERLSPDVAAVVDKATAAQPRDRHASIDDVRAALQAVQRTREPAGAAELAHWVATRTRP